MRGLHAGGGGSRWMVVMTMMSRQWAWRQRPITVASAPLMVQVQAALYEAAIMHRGAVLGRPVPSRACHPGCRTLAPASPRPSGGLGFGLRPRHIHGVTHHEVWHGTRWRPPHGLHAHTTSHRTAPVVDELQHGRKHARHLKLLQPHGDLPEAGRCRALAAGGLLLLQGGLMGILVNGVVDLQCQHDPSANGRDVMCACVCACLCGCLCVRACMVGRYGTRRQELGKWGTRHVVG